MSGRPVPSDGALPQVGRLLDAEAVAPVLESMLGDGELTAAKVKYVRYRPAARLLVRYEVVAGETAYEAFALADASADLAGQAVSPESAALAERVRERAPARTPLGYDAELGALIQWPPLDLALPALAEPPDGLRGRLEDAGLQLASADDLPRLVKHKPATRAVFRLERHVAKAYADDASFERSVRALRTAAALPVVTARCEAVVPDLRLAAQDLLPGERPARAEDVAAEAGALLARLHACELPGLATELPRDRFAETVEGARVLAALVPELAPRLDALLAALELGLPAGGELVTSHGGFHLSQLLQTDGGLGVIDFDGLCAAPPARDVASYVASLVDEPGDLPGAHTTLDSLCRAYGSRPEGVAWYMTTLLVRRARRPFARFRDGWPEAIETRVAAAEAALGG